MCPIIISFSRSVITRTRFSLIIRESEFYCLVIWESIYQKRILDSHAQPTRAFWWETVWRSGCGARCIWESIRRGFSTLMLSLHVPSGEKQSGEAGVVQDVLNITRLHIVAKAHASPRNSTWLTRPLFLMRGWGLGIRQRILCYDGKNACQTATALANW